MIRAVVFDIGECLLDRTREYGAWADWLGVPRHTFSAVFGAVVAQGRDFRETFQIFRPGFDLAEERARRDAAGVSECCGEEDLYSDVRPALSALRENGLWVGIAGNQSRYVAASLRALRLPADLVTASGDRGISKPNPAFFRHLVDAAPAEPHEILYVGDQLRNDVHPALRAGLLAAWIRRGPWGLMPSGAPADSVPATMQIDSLAQLPRLIAEFNESAR
ncbi:HAD family hydrolase [Streptomyces physcomitrii]|uniref:HAD family hydrolase n=1 Tax=Streptomyces physcomitrii TaxID=2724184 RepID=UPI003449363F